MNAVLEENREPPVELVNPQELHEAGLNNNINDDLRGDPVLPATMGMDDPRRMILTRQETTWALNIKHAIEGTPELDNLTDFWYAQFAIICEDNIEEVVKRALGLQAYRQEYKILDTYNDANRRLRAYTSIFPTTYLSFSFSPLVGTYIIVQDGTKLDTTLISSPAQEEDFFAGGFYLHALLGSDFESLRKGEFWIVETEGFYWTQKQNFKLMRRGFSELLTVYPFQATLKLFNAGIVFNTVFSCCRAILPKNIRDRIEGGLTCDARLDSCFLVPSLEAARQRLLSRIEITLTRRYDNEATFTLSGGN